MKAFTVALVVGLVCVVGASPADAATGTKVFLNDCTLTMWGGEGRAKHPVLRGFRRRDQLR